MNDFLLGAADESSGGAVERSRWRPDRILSRRALNLIVTAAGSAGVALVLMNLFFGPGPTATADESPYSPSEAFVSPVPSGWAATQPVPPASGTSIAPIAVASTSTSAAASPQTSSEPGPATRDERTYAVSFAELQGLPEDAPPGTSLELWVMWSDAATDQPKLQRLIKSVTLEKIAPAIVEGAPPVAILRVAAQDVPDLIWGDQYGTLSAVMRPLG